MIDMGVDPFLVASSVILIVAQRLGRRLCNNCKEPIEAPKERLLEVGFTERNLKEEFTIYKPVGCALCNHGYKGRFALLEALVMTEAVKRCIIDGGSAIDIKKIALDAGMITLRKCGILNVMRGITGIEEILNVTMVD
jgi:type IV pilus assembly protein PilB